MPADELVELAAKKSTPKWVKSFIWVGVISSGLTAAGLTVIPQVALADPKAREAIANLTNDVRAVQAEIQRIDKENKERAAKLGEAYEKIQADVSDLRAAQTGLTTLGAAHSRTLERVDDKLDRLLERAAAPGR